MKIKERENICLDLLRKLPQKLVLIGGYAASSFDFPRFSVDLDLVIRPRDAREFSKILEREGFRLLTDSGHFADFYKGRMMRFAKKIDALPITVDLFVGMVQARQTDTAYSFDYLWKNSEVRKVLGSGVKDYAEVRVADREMLIALKMNSMRMADQRDIISLFNGKVDPAKILTNLKRATKGKILGNIAIISATLQKPESRDSIKGVFGISDQVYKKLIEKARKEILSIRQELSGDE